MDFIKFRKFDFIVAPYEADSQLAFLSLKKEIDYVVSDDSDLFAFGCLKIIKGIKMNGDCKVLDLVNKRSESPHIDNLLHLDRDKQLTLYVMAGCDYLDNIKGIGFLIVLKALQGENSKNFLKELVEKKTAKSDACAYFKSVELSKYSFNHQLVFESDKKKNLYKLRNLNPIPSSGKRIDSEEAEQYIGKSFSNARQYCQGERNLDNENMDRPSQKHDFDKLMRFFCYAPLPTLGCMSNLTERVITYENFDDFASLIGDEEQQEKIFESIQQAKDLIKKRKNEIISMRNRKYETEEIGNTNYTSEEYESQEKIITPKIKKIEKTNKNKKQSKKIIKKSSNLIKKTKNRAFRKSKRLENRNFGKK